MTRIKNPPNKGPVPLFSSCSNRSPLLGPQKRRGPNRSPPSICLETERGKCRISSTSARTESGPEGPKKMSHQWSRWTFIKSGFMLERNNEGGHRLQKPAGAQPRLPGRGRSRNIPVCISSDILQKRPGNPRA